MKFPRTSLYPRNISNFSAYLTRAAHVFLSGCMRVEALVLICAIATLGVTALARAQTEQTLVSNIEQSRDAMVLRQAGAYQAFTTGSNATGYVVSSVEVHFTSGSASASHITASMYEMRSGELHTKVADLINPDSITFGSNIFLAPEGTSLSAGTSYVVVFSIIGNWNLGGTYSGSEDSDSQSDWSIEDTYYNLVGSEYTAPLGRFSLMIRVNGVITLPPSDDATLSGLTLTDTGAGTGIELDPTFTGDELEYTALVPTGIETITLDATSNHSGAMLEYMNGKEGMLSDKDPDTEDFQVGLIVGANAFKVQVEAENGMKQIYTVSVTRQGPPLTLDLDTIAGEDVVNIQEKADGFAISGYAGHDEMGSMDESTVMVDIGGETLTATTDSTGEWSVNVPPVAEYLVEPDVTVTVNASGMNLTDAPEVTRELAVDLTPPALESAMVEGDRLTLTFDEPLAERAVSPDAFSVFVNGSVVSASIATAVGGDTVTLAMPFSVSAGDTVTLTYTSPTGTDPRPIRDVAGNEAVALTNHAVTNNTKPGEQCAGSDESLRLADGGEAKEGRLEVCADDDTSDNTPARWGTVCDDYWTNDDADVACRVLGYERSEPHAGRFRSSYFGAGTGPIWLDDLLCDGDESNLLDCPLASRRRARGAIGVHNCRSGEIVGVRCMAAGEPLRPHVTFQTYITGPGADGYYAPGDGIRVAFTFNEPVTVDVSGGTPTIGLTLGSNGGLGRRTATYTGGSGTKQIEFEYRVVAGDGEFAELDAVRYSLVANGGTIRNSQGVDALLANPSASTSSALEPPSPTLSVADATVEEGARLEFQVSLSKAVDDQVSVTYRTVEATARAGSDYEAASGTLTFAPGQTRKTVQVITLDDAHDEGQETFTLRLSAASGARITDNEATGTISNSDPLPQGWLARFGRTSAAQVVDMLDDRFDEAAAPASQFTLGGQTWRVAELRDEPRRVHNRAPPESNDDLPGYTAGWSNPSGVTGPASAGTATAAIEATLLERTLWGLLTNSGWQADKRRFLSRSSFDLSLSGRDGEAIETATAVPEAPGHWSLWGRGALTHFAGIDEGVNLNGDVLTGLLGLDYARNRWLAGVALSYSDGNGNYRAAGNGAAGELDSTLVSVHPYLRYALTARLSVWGTLGYGAGTLRLHPGRDQDTIETDMQMSMGAMGLRGIVYATQRTELALKSDALWVRTASDAAPGLQAVDGADANRVRLLLSGRHERVLANGGVITPSIELGVRYDDGDAETGLGVELGGGLRYADLLRGLTLETTARALLAHEDGGYEEWGVGGTLQFDPGVLGRGPAFSLASGWGVTGSGAQELWLQQDMAGLARRHYTAPEGRIKAEWSYGLDVPWTYGIQTPYSSMELAGSGRTVRLGWRFELGHSLSLSLDGERRETSHEAPDHTLMLRTSLPW